MKNLCLGILLSFLLIKPIFSQEISTKNQDLSPILSVGIALGSEHNIGNWGLFISNDLKVALTQHLALNPRITYFETLAGVEDDLFKGYNSHSGIFLDLGLSYSFIRQKNYAFSLNAGPSFELGNETRTFTRTFVDTGLTEETFGHSRIRRFGFYTDLEYSWNREGKYLHTVALKTYSFDIYPEFLGLGYKIGFKL